MEKETPAISNEITAKVIKYLKQVEDENNVKVIYATEFGSRLWGWSSASSDCDVRFIYIHNIDWYVSINEEKKRDVIDLELKEESLELHGWEIRKMFKMLRYDFQFFVKERQSNPSAIECLRAPYIYVANEHFVQSSLHLARKFLGKRSLVSQYIGSAEKHIKPLFCILYLKKNEDKDFPPISLQELIASLDFSKESRLQILLDLLEKKKSDQFVKEGRKIRYLDDWIQEMMKEATEWKIPYGKAAPTQEFDALLLEYVLKRSNLIKSLNQ